MCDIQCVCVFAGAYPGFEKGGCLRRVVVSIYRAQSARDFFSRPRPLIAHAPVNVVIIVSRCGRPCPV